MNKEIIIQRLRASEPNIRRFGVGGLFLFGSLAKDMEHENSDVDLFFDLDKKEGFTLFDLAVLHEELEHVVGTKVDIMSRNGIHPRRRSNIENSAIQIF